MYLLPAQGTPFGVRSSTCPPAGCLSAPARRRSGRRLPGRQLLWLPVRVRARHACVVCAFLGWLSGSMSSGGWPRTAARRQLPMTDSAARDHPGETFGTSIWMIGQLCHGVANQTAACRINMHQAARCVNGFLDRRHIIGSRCSSCELWHLHKGWAYLSISVSRSVSCRISGFHSQGLTPRQTGGGRGRECILYPARLHGTPPIVRGQALWPGALSGVWRGSATRVVRWVRTVSSAVVIPGFR